MGNGIIILYATWSSSYRHLSCPLGSQIAFCLQSLECFSKGRYLVGNVLGAVTNNYLLNLVGFRQIVYHRTDVD